MMIHHTLGRWPEGAWYGEPQGALELMQQSANQQAYAKQVLKWAAQMQRDRAIEIHPVELHA